MSKDKAQQFIKFRETLATDINCLTHRYSQLEVVLESALIEVRRKIQEERIVNK